MHRIVSVMAVVGVLLAAGLPWLLVRVVDPLPPAFRPTQTALADLLLTATANAQGGVPDDGVDPTSAVLIATPFSTAAVDVTASASPTPPATSTPTVAPTATPEPGVVLRVLSDTRSYSCPGKRFRTDQRVSEGARMQVLGRSDTAEGAWVLVEDNIEEDQVWLLLDAAVAIAPAGAHQHLPTVACRVGAP